MQPPTTTKPAFKNGLNIPKLRRNNKAFLDEQQQNEDDDDDDGFNSTTAAAAAASSSSSSGSSGGILLESRNPETKAEAWRRTTTTSTRNSKSRNPLESLQVPGQAHLAATAASSSSFFLQNRSRKYETSGSASALRSVEKVHQEALAQEPTIFDYDAVYDTLKKRKEDARQLKKSQSQHGKSKYMEALLHNAAVRKLEQFGARERTNKAMADRFLKSEFEDNSKPKKEENDENDEEIFITSAYREAMAKLKDLEEKEKQRAQEILVSRQRRLGGNGDDPSSTTTTSIFNSSGMSEFYSTLLNNNNNNNNNDDDGAGGIFIIHPAVAVDATAAEPARKTTDQQQQLRADELGSKAVRVNLSGEVVDKRDLLNAGLNIVRRNNTRLPPEAAPSTGIIAEAAAAAAAAAVGVGVCGKSRSTTRIYENESKKRSRHYHQHHHHQQPPMSPRASSTSISEGEIEKTTGLSLLSELLSSSKKPRNDLQSVSDARTRYLARKEKQKQNSL